MPGRAEADVVLLGVLLVEAQPRRVLGRRRRATPFDAPAAGETRRSRELDDALVVEVPGGADDDVGAGVAGLVVGVDVGDRDRGDHLGLAEHPPPERVLAEDGAGEDVVDPVLRLVLVHRDLLEHDVALGVDFG